MDFHCQELELNVEFVVCLNNAQYAEAIKEAEVCCATTACALQQPHKDSVLMVECKAKVEEGWDCQAFMEAFVVAMQACLPETHGALMYPLQLLTGDVPLAAILGMSATSQLWAVADRGSVLAPPTLSMLGTPAPQEAVKC